MQNNYYCLIAGLPDIIIEQNKLSFSLSDFKLELKNILHKKDYQLIEYLFLPFDNKNVLNILSKNNKPFEKSGNFSENEINLAIDDPINNPLPISYFNKFIINYKNETKLNTNLSWENQITELYYDYLLKIKNTFLKDWLEFELNLKNIITAHNCRKYNFPLEKEIIGDNDIAKHLKENKTKSKDFDFDNTFDGISYIQDLLRILDNTNLNLSDRKKNIDLLKWKYLDEKITFKYFSMEVVISYAIKLSITEKWINLDKKSGEEMFNKLLKDLETSFQFPDEFNLNYGKK
ncbi:MAG: DUF2764 family protein [Bacteroidales bacterium]|nr:DUF2764 family protein [Bacteroidales bacterium]